MRTLCLAVAFLLSLSAAPARTRAQIAPAVEPPATETETSREALDAAAAGTRPSDAAATSPPARRGADWPWAIVALGGALVVAALVTGGLTLERQAELDRVCAPHSCPPAAERSQAEGRALAFSTDALGVGGLVVATAGIVLAVALPTTSEAVVAAASCGPSGCTLTLRGAF